MRVKYGTRYAYPKHVTDDVRHVETTAICTEQL